MPPKPLALSPKRRLGAVMAQVMSGELEAARGKDVPIAWARSWVAARVQANMTGTFPWKVSDNPRTIHPEPWAAIPSQFHT